MARRILLIASWLWVGAILAYWAGLRLLGERWWLTTLVLYLPHIILLVPLAALASATAWWGPRRLLLLHAGAALVVVVPIMGFAVFNPFQASSATVHLRVLSFNIGSGRRSIEAAIAEIQSLRPDIVVLQESSAEINDRISAALPDFAHRTSTQFLVASRYPIVELHEPPKLAFAGVERSPRFVRATLDTPLGKVDLYNIHPISPRDAIDGVRAEGPNARGSDGERGIVGNNTALRRLQVQEIARQAAASPNPVIIAGDTNLPGSSRIFAELLGQWQDGFDVVGRGFGYTFPVGRHGAWMRIDRILAGKELRFLEMGVGHGPGSDHYCVWADLQRAQE